MKKNQIKVGGVYTAKVSKKVVRVRIEGVNRSGGWDAVNLQTKKKVRIKSAQRLRGAVKSDESNVASGDGKRTKTPTAKATKKADAKPKRLSAIDAAAEVLRKSKEPMRSRELIAAMQGEGLWTSPGGKTPHATLYAAMIREISAKGKDARFTKTDRGLFAINGKAK